MGATAVVEIDTEADRDARAIFEKQQEINKVNELCQEKAYLQCFPTCNTQVRHKQCSFTVKLLLHNSVVHGDVNYMLHDHASVLR